MSNGIGGFFVPGSITGSYVANKRNEQGSYKYEAQSASVGMQKQAALQELEKSYEETINKAYGSYLANQQALRTLNIGQGYKELYEQAEQENLLAQQKDTALNVSNLKSQLATQTEQTQANIKEQYIAEVNNLDRVARSMSEYLAYVGSLSKPNSEETGYTYLSNLTGMNITENTLAEDIYDKLYSAQPTDFEDSEGKRGLAYSQWLHEQMQNSDADAEFERWLYSGGWQDFQKYAGLYKESTDEGKAYTEIEQKRQEEYKAAKAEYEKKQTIAEYDTLGKNYGLSGEEIYNSAAALNMNGQDYIKLTQNSLASGIKVDNSKGSTRFAYPGDTTTDKYGNKWEYAAQPQLLAQYGNQPYKDSKIEMYANAVGVSAERIKAMNDGDIFKVGENYYLFQKFGSNFTIGKITKK